MISALRRRNMTLLFVYYLAFTAQRSSSMVFPGFRETLRALVGFLVVPVLLLSSCKSTHYDLELHPQEDKIQRQLAIWVDSGKEKKFGEVDIETATRIAAQYQAVVPENLEARLQFSATFGPEMPQDIGGVGWYNYWPSSMGALYSYTEQFGGNENLADSLDRDLVVIDRLLQALTLWLEAEFEGASDLEQLTAAVNNEFRADFRNLFLLSWVDEVSPEGAFEDDELPVRIAQYLSNRGYFEPADMPQFWLATAALDDDSDEEMVGLITRGIATRMGVPKEDALPPSLSALGEDWEAYGDSFETFVESSEQILALAHEWAAEDGGNVDLDKEGKLDPDSIFDNFLEMNIFSAGSSSALQATLHLPREPLETNGDWDEEASIVTWSDRIDLAENPIELPASHFAFWVEPAAEFQTKRFRTVIIDDDELVEYALWSNSLTTEQRAEWEALLKNLDAESNAVNELESFRFSDHPQGTTVIYSGIRELLKQLDDHPEEADETKIE
jgi:hypothetical protein